MSTCSCPVRYSPSQADVTNFKALSGAPSSSFAHALRWYNHIKSFGAAADGFPGTKAPAAPAKPAPAPAPAKPAPADDDDEDVDLFGDDDDEEVLLLVDHNQFFGSLLSILFLLSRLPLQLRS